MNNTATGHTLDLMFRHARTPRAWTDRPIAHGLLEEIYDLLMFIETAGESQHPAFDQ